jgi:hypothetical protein
MVRAPYRTACRFLRDSDQEATIHWYVVPWSNGTIGIPSPINSSYWRPFWFNPGRVGEVNFAPRHYDGWGRIVPPIPGDHLCGEAEDFRRGGLYQPSLPPFERAADGVSLCCRPELGGVLLGGDSYIGDPVPVSDGGALLSGSAVAEDIIPGPSAGSAPLIVPGVWYAYDSAMWFGYWFRWASSLGQRWGIDTLYNFPPVYAFGPDRVWDNPAALGSPFPWDVFTTGYKEVTQTTNDYGWPWVFYDMRQTNGVKVMFRVRGPL